MWGPKKGLKVCFVVKRKVSQLYLTAFPLALGVPTSHCIDTFFGRGKKFSSIICNIQK